MTEDDPIRRAHDQVRDALNALPVEQRLHVLTMSAASNIVAYYEVQNRPKVLRGFDKSVRDGVLDIADAMDALRDVERKA